MKTIQRNSTRLIFFGAATLVLALSSAFFIFYTVRLLWVTHWLTAIRAGGQGAYIGAIVFPLLALGLGWGAWRCAKRLRSM